MKTTVKLMKFGMLLPLLSLLAGCETPQSEKPPVTNLKPFKAIGWDCKDTPETRKQVIAHNSVLATLKSGKKTVYADDCVEQKPQPKTS